MGGWGRVREMAGDISTGLGGLLVEVGEREISSRSSAIDLSSSGRVSTPRGWALRVPARLRGGDLCSLFGRRGLVLPNRGALLGWIVRGERMKIWERVG